MENTVTFLMNPLKNNKVWAVMTYEGELMYDLMSVKRAEFCLAEKEQFWMNPFGGTFQWDTKVSQPYEAEFVFFKKEAQQYMCIFDLEIAHLQYVDYAPATGELVFDEAELSKRLDDKTLSEFKRFMNELWEYVKESV
jgi:hypothetical protein